MTRIGDIATFLEEWAPPATAQSYDNVGLQIGDPERDVSVCLIALDMTPAVLQEARNRGAQLVVTHHPLIFRPLKRLTPGSWSESLALRVAESQIALYAIHTNADAALSGISFALAERLGLEDVGFLEPLSSSLFKLVTFIPESHAERVRQALGEAGAGRIGAYTNCSFELKGTGYFQPMESASPFIGTPGGELESVPEIRLEMEVPRWLLGSVVAALKKAHPYEEVAYDVYPVEQPYTQAGMGALGTLPDAMPLSGFLEHLSKALGTDAVRFCGSIDAPVKRVAVCGGSGSGLLPAALRAQVDAYVTADITYHTFFDVLDESGKPKMALIDAGHYETEAMSEHLLQETLAGAFPEVLWIRTETRTSPIFYHVSEQAKL